MNIHWLMRAKRWAQNPPSSGRVKLVLAVIGICLALWLVDLVWGWPDFLTVERMGRRP